MIVTPSVTANVILSGNTSVTVNSSTLITAIVINRGSATTYTWQDSTENHNWQDIAGSTGIAIAYTPGETGDKIRCKVVTNASCLVNNTLISAPLTFTVDTPDGGRIAPNPVNNVLIIGELSLNDKWTTAEIASAGSGSRMIVQSVAGQTTVSIPVAKLTKGLYVVLLRSSTGATKRLKFLKQ